MTLRRVTAVASHKAAVGFRTLRDNPPLPAFTSFPSSFDYDVTRAATVVLGVERGDTARFSQC